MIDFLLFIVFSILEGLAVFYLMFKLFRFQTGLFDKYSILIVSIISLNSYILTHFNHASIVPLVQLLIMIVLVSLFQGVNFLYSLKMSVTTYIIYALINIGMVNILYYLDIIKTVDLDPFMTDAFIAQSASLLAAIGLARVLINNKLGFTYIPIERLRIKYTKLNSVILFVSIILVIGFSLLMFGAIEQKNLELIWIVGVFTLLGAYSLIHLSMKKEYE